MENDIVIIRDDVLLLLDELIIEKDNNWWSCFYSDKTRKCPFFTESPDENLVKLVSTEMLKPQSDVLELGCGEGRNAIYLCNNGFNVDAIDFSERAINAAIQKTRNDKNGPNFICSSIFKYSYSKQYDFIYDSGCFHHIAPHRRPDYLGILNRSLKPNGIYGLVCFNQNGGSGLSDLEVYIERSLRGGLAYSKEKIEAIFKQQFDIFEIREMEKMDDNKSLFGETFLWVCLMRKKESYI